MDHIDFVVHNGSIFLALQEQYIQPHDLLIWLKSQNVTYFMLTAYKALCLHLHPDQHYIDNVHFLTMQPKYIPIAEYYGFNTEIYFPDRVIPETCPTDIDTVLYGRQSEALVRMSILAHHCPAIREYSGHDYNKRLVPVDWFSRFRYNERLPKLILDRIAKIKDTDYYLKVVRKHYSDVVAKLNVSKLFAQTSREELALLHSYFPEIINPRVLSYSDLGYKLFNLSNEVAGYLLGFPIQHMIPNDEQIHLSITKLDEESLDSYCDFIKDYVNKTYCFNTPLFKLANETDVYYIDQIDEFSPFDVVSYQDDEHLYRFSRNEFAGLIQSQKNPYTNLWLPTHVLATIKARLFIATTLDLPPCKPLKELLTIVNEHDYMKLLDEPEVLAQNSDVDSVDQSDDDYRTDENLQDWWYEEEQGY
jgi:hypothetical protein